MSCCGMLLLYHVVVCCYVIACYDISHVVIYCYVVLNCNFTCYIIKCFAMSRCGISLHVVITTHVTTHIIFNNTGKYHVMLWHITSCYKLLYVMMLRYICLRFPMCYIMLRHCYVITSHM